MARAIGVLGPSGSGKTTSMRNLNHEETLLINIAAKDVPLPNAAEKYKKKEWVGEEETHNRVDTHHPATVENVLKAADKKGNFKNVVIDDVQYFMSFEFMQRIKEKGWDKFQDIALHFYKVIQETRQLRDDMNVFFLGHTAEKDDGLKGLKTVGEATDQYMKPEGLFTMILQTEVFMEEEDMSDRYKFMTQSDGERVCRTPMGMFDKMFIPNDLQLVVERMEEYYGR